MSQVCKTALVYCATHLATGRKYVGFTTTTLRLRRSQHERAAALGKTGCRYFYAALREYGACAFEWEVLGEFADAALGVAAEVAAIVDLGTRAPDGFNLTAGGDRPEWHADSRAKMAESARTSPKAAAHRARMHSSPAVAEAISRALKGRKMTPEWIAKMAATLTGRKQTPEHVANATRHLRGRPVSQETRDKSAASNRGKKRSEQTRARLRAARAADPGHAERMRTLAVGQRKIQSEQEPDVVRMRNGGMSQRAIADHFHVSHAAVQKLLRRLAGHV